MKYAYLFIMFITIMMHTFISASFWTFHKKEPTASMQYNQALDNLNESLYDATVAYCLDAHDARKDGPYFIDYINSIQWRIVEVNSISRKLSDSEKNQDISQLITSLQPLKEKKFTECIKYAYENIIQNTQIRTAPDIISLRQLKNKYSIEEFKNFEVASVKKAMIAQTHRDNPREFYKQYSIALENIDLNAVSVAHETKIENEIK